MSNAQFVNTLTKCIKQAKTDPQKALSTAYQQCRYDKQKRFSFWESMGLESISIGHRNIPTLKLDVIRDVTQNKFDLAKVWLAEIQRITNSHATWFGSVINKQKTCRIDVPVPSKQAVHCLTVLRSDFE